MKAPLIRNLKKRVLRRWGFLGIVLLSMFLLNTYLVVKTMPFSSMLEPDYPREDKILTESSVKDANRKQNGDIIEKTFVFADNGDRKRNGRARNQNEVIVQGQKPEPEVQPPLIEEHPLYVNEEGMGQDGKAVIINKANLSQRDQKLYDLGYKRHDFNEYISDLISVDRSVPELRDPFCLSETFPNDLPDTSVIICFLNEAWSVLVRSVHSVINTSPPHLLREIILVDDQSDYDYLKAPLEAYMKKFPKVKIIRNSAREGLIRTRLNGAKAATGQVLTFLDSHIECAAGWLQPLLARIKENSSHVVWPAVAIISRDTFEITHRNPEEVLTGVFSWELNFRWESPNLKERERLASPIRSPTMAGGLFSIDREYFYHVGSYDEDMRFWGGENLEMSFRIWMCGGTIEIIPCSLVGHIYRTKNVNANPVNARAITNNTIRLAMVWLGQYKYLYTIATGQKLVNYGDISSRLELRKKLKCKSFEWYLTNVYPSVFIPEKALTSGLIHSVHDATKCLKVSGETIQVSECNKQDLIGQVFYWTENEELRSLVACLDTGVEHPIMHSCHKAQGTQHFLHRQDDTIFNPTRGKCLQWLTNTPDLELLPCDRNPRQLWVLEKVPLDFKTNISQ